MKNTNQNWRIEMQTEIKKYFKLICETFGHKFSFEADCITNAENMKNEWCNYHSYNPVNFSVEETTDSKWIHNEYFNN